MFKWVGGIPTCRLGCPRCLRSSSCLVTCHIIIQRMHFLLLKGLGCFFLAGRTFMLSETFIFPCMLDLQNWGCLSVIWPESACFMAGLCELVLDSDILDIFWWSVLLFMDQSQFSVVVKLVRYWKCRHAGNVISWAWRILFHCKRPSTSVRVDH